MLPVGELLVDQMEVREGVMEQLKETDQLKWVRTMNNIRCSVEEMVLAEIVYE